MPFDNVPVKPSLSPEIEADLRVLRLTRDYIAAKGVCKGLFIDDRGDHCVVGWLRYVTSSKWRADHIAERYLAPVTPGVDRFLSGNSFLDILRYTTEKDPVALVTMFNDNPATTRLDMVNLIDRAIARAEG